MKGREGQWGSLAVEGRHRSKRCEKENRRSRSVCRSCVNYAQSNMLKSKIERVESKGAARVRVQHTPGIRSKHSLLLYQEHVSTVLIPHHPADAPPTAPTASCNPNKPQTNAEQPGLTQAEDCAPSGLKDWNRPADRSPSEPGYKRDRVRLTSRFTAVVVAFVE